jgi:hypothetical protein
MLNIDNLKKLFLNQYTAIAVISFVSLWIYVELSSLWVAIGGYSKILLIFDYPLVCTFAILFYFPINFKKYRIINFIFPFIPIYGLYLIYDTFYNYLDRSLRVSDILDYGALLNAMPLSAILLIIIIITIFIPVIFLLIKWVKEVGFSKAKYILLLKTIVSLGLIFFVSTDIYSTYQKNNIYFKHGFEFQGKKSIRQLGRFNSIIYYHNKKKEALDHIKSIIKNSNNLDANTALYPTEIKDKPNIHIIVLESFFDPELIVDGDFNPAPLAEELEKFLGPTKGFSHVISPVFGGSTAQAEFEIITGVPALAKIESIEFNTMDGSPINSFVRKLRNSGYFASAMIGSNDSYFNSRIAYKSLGFEQVIFLRENMTILDNIKRKLFGNNTDDKDLFDGDLFESNLEMLEHISQKNIGEKPIINYILGFYGHYPFNRNIQKRPDVIASSHPNKKVQNVANQFYYRTKSLALFINKLLQIDPKCIILVFGDHLPALFNNSTKYKKSIYETVSFLLKNGEYLDIAGKKFYEITWLIWDILSKSEPEGKREFSNTELTNIYFRIIAQGMGME